MRDGAPGHIWEARSSGVRMVFSRPSSLPSTQTKNCPLKLRAYGGKKGTDGAAFAAGGGVVWNLTFRKIFHSLQNDVRNGLSSFRHDRSERK